MEFEVLGPLEVRDREGAVRLSPKLAQLLAAFLAKPNTLIGEERLIDALWGEDPPRSALKSLQVYVHHLRQMLGEPDRLERGPTGYRFTVGPDELDAARFSRAVAEARRELAAGDLASAGERLARALRLWRGPAFSGHETMPLVREEATRLNEMRQSAAEERIDAELALGGHGRVVAELTALVAEHPYRERLRGQLMTALHRVGRSGEALAVYREGRRILNEELGLDPGGELRALEQAILNDDPALAPPAEPPRPRSAVSAPLPAQLPPDIADFTGRDGQVRTLTEGLSAPGAADRSRTVVVSAIAGMGGVGKTALAVHVAHAQSERFPDGQLYVNLRGTDTDPAEPAQVLSRFLLALGVEGTAIPESMEDRSGVFRSRLADRRMLLILDNAASEQQVRPLIPGAPGCAVVVTSRVPLTGLESARLINLDVFEPEQAVELLAGIVGGDRASAEPGAAAEIARLCGYAPLAVRIAGARLAGRPRWSLEHMARLLRDEQRRLDELATGDLAVRSSFALSFAGLDIAARRLFRLLGTLEVPDFPSWVAAAVLDTAVEGAEGHIETLLDAQLLTIAGSDQAGQLRYRLHDLVRLYGRERAEAEDPPEERRAALRRAFGAWLWLFEQASEYIPGTSYATMHGSAPRWPLPLPVATRLLGDPMACFDAEWAAAVAAIRQACPMGEDELAWDLAGCMEKYFDVRGRFDEWRRTHETAIAACRAAGNRRGEAVLRRGLADLTTWTTEQNTHDAMAALYEQAEQVLEMFRDLGDPRGMADALVMRTWGLVSSKGAQRALDSARAALELAERADYLAGRARAYHVMAVVAHIRGRNHDAVEHLTKALELAELLGNSRFKATATQFLGAALCEIGEVESGREHLLRSLAMTRAHQDRYAEVFSLLYLTRLYLRLGDPQARETAETAAGLSRRHAMNHHLADALELLGRVHLDGGDTAAAVAALEESVRLWRTRGWLSFLVPALRTLGRAYEAAGKEHAARLVREEAEELEARDGATVQAEGARPAAG